MRSNQYKYNIISNTIGAADKIDSPYSIMNNCALNRGWRTGKTTYKLCLYAVVAATQKAKKIDNNGL